MMFIFLECKLYLRLKLKQNIMKDTDFCPKELPFMVAALMELKIVKIQFNLYNVPVHLKVTDKCFKLNIIE